MHVRWRGLELPSRVVKDSKSYTQNFGRFIIEPFEPGFGTTIGNSLHRVLLSSIEGAAITKVRITGVEHEFSSLPGVLEDVTDIILNIKGVVVSMSGDAETKTLRLEATGPGDVTADLIECDSSVEIHNPEKVIATLTDKVDFGVEFTVARGRGYMPASEQFSKGEQLIGEIEIDAIFSPVQRVRFHCEDTRVGQKTTYQRLVMDIWTNGTVSPEMALVEASKILRKHLNPFVQFEDIGSSVVSEDVASQSATDDEFIRKLQMPVSELDLSVRARNCLETARIETIAELVCRTEDDLLGVRSFGKTSLKEVEEQLAHLDLHLGMQLPEGVLPS